ncbi:protein FAM227A [Psammomys obesus]|uniref:protein FAM227A n=1 Tax=Psammomys obesus TaxID=48139 RepID=UPI00245302A3|nr:protein FAM227A [Psammomys obesus]
MKSSKRLDSINAIALPIIPLDESQVVSASARKDLENAVRKQLQDHPPTCIIGSLSQVSQRVTEADTNYHRMDHTLAIEDYELEKKSIKERTHSSPGDRAKRPKEEPTIPCKGSEARNPRVNLTKRQTADKNLLAERHEHPPFDETKPNKLPNGVAFCDMVGNVIRSEKNTLSGKCFCSDRELEKFLSAPSPSAIWLDSFWWIFHERYQPNKEIQSKLFDRVARNYASLLMKTVRSHYEEALIKRLPSLLSKALYTSFCCCFPQSWFNTHEFKSEICNTMNLWISGTYPCPQSYNNWDYSELDPERFRREELLHRSSRLIKGYRSDFQTGHPNEYNIQRLCRKLRPTPNSFFPLGKYSRSPFGCITLTEHFMASPTSRKATQQVKRISETRACLSLYLKASHPACKNPKLISNQFNLYGESPLIVYFFLNYAELRKRGQDVLVSRREKTEMIPESAPTYADIIHQVMENMERRKRKLRELDRLHWNEWVYFKNYLKELKENCAREVALINKKAAEKKKANLTVLLSLDDSSDKKPKGNTHIETTLLRKERNIEEKQKLRLQSISSTQSPPSNYSLDLKSPYGIQYVSSASEPGTSRSRSSQDEVLFRLSPSSME